MRINAYILVSDPTWITTSVLSYYEAVQEIVVSYDEDFLTWKGGPATGLQECLDKLRAIDWDKKLRFSPGNYARLDHHPMENETFQRECALREAGANSDWVLQLDTDEVLPSAKALVGCLECADELEISAVEWPMRVLFQRLRDGRYLEVCARDKKSHYEYPGPVAVRSDVTLSHARRTTGEFLRPVVVGDKQSLQISRPPERGEIRVPLGNPDDAIIHNSWARSPRNIRQKITSWGHSGGLKPWMFYYCAWKTAPYLWRHLRNFHPFARGLWPALKPCDCLSELTLEPAACP